MSWLRGLFFWNILSSSQTEWVNAKHVWSPTSSQESKADLLLFPIPDIRHAEQQLDGTALTEPQPAKATTAIPFISSEGYLGFAFNINQLLWPLSLIQTQCVRTQLLRQSNASAVSPIIIITGKERGRIWLESIKTRACLVQEKYLFCIGKNVNIVTKRSDSSSTLNMPLWGRSFEHLSWNWPPGLGLHSVNPPQSSIGTWYEWMWLSLFLLSLRAFEKELVFTHPSLWLAERQLQSFNTNYSWISQPAWRLISLPTQQQ